MKRACRSASRKRRGPPAAKVKDPDTIALEKRVSDALGLAVSVNHRDPGGSVQISYRNLEQLDEVMRRLAKGGLISVVPSNEARPGNHTPLAVSFGRFRRLSRQLPAHRGFRSLSRKRWSEDA